MKIWEQPMVKKAGTCLSFIHKEHCHGDLVAWFSEEWNVLSSTVLNMPKPHLFIIVSRTRN